MFDWSEIAPSVQSWEFLGFITGILSVLLLIPTKHPRLQWTNWIFSIVSAAVYFYLFREWTLYGNMALQVPFVIISVIGAFTWIGQLGVNWSNPTLDKIRTLPTKYTTLTHLYLSCGAAVVAFIPTYFILDHYGDASPWWDGWILTISLAAIYLQLRKYVQSWYLWILVDMIAVPFHYSQSREATALLYAAYMLMCFFGLRAWEKEASDNLKSGPLFNQEQLLKGRVVNV